MIWSTDMTKKQYLRQGYKIRQEIKIQRDILIELENNLDNVKSFDYSKEKLQGGMIQDDTVMIEKINRILEVQEIIKEKEAELKRLQANLYLEINRLTNTNEKILLQARYILNETWEQIAERVGYSVAQTHRIHKSALENFKFF